MSFAENRRNQICCVHLGITKLPKAAATTTMALGVKCCLAQTFFFLSFWKRFLSRIKETFCGFEFLPSSVDFKLAFYSNNLKQSSTDSQNIEIVVYTEREREENKTVFNLVKVCK